MLNITLRQRPRDYYEPQARLFKTLMHPARLAILDVLREGEECVCHMEAVLGYRQAYISQQLMVLRDAGLVKDRRDGWNIFYRVTDARIFAVLDAAQNMTSAASRTGRRKPTQAVSCPCPKCKPVAEAAVG